MPRAARVLLILILSVLLLLGAAVALLESPWAKQWLVDRLSEGLEREIHIGELDFAWDWPPRVRLTDVRVANADWAGPEPMLRAKGIAAAINPLSLLQGQLDLQRLHLEHPIAHLAQREDGIPNWRFGEDGGDEGAGAGLDVRVGALSVDQGRLSYRDPRAGTELRTQISTFQTTQGQRRLRVQGQGRLQDMPLQFAATGAAPAQLLKDGRPYPLDLTADWGGAHIRFDGSVAQLRGIEGLRGQLRMQGPAAADVGRLLGAPTLDLPAFALSGELSHGEDQWALRDFQLQVGDNRLAGSVALEQGETPRLEAKLQAQTLDLNELGLASSRPATENPAVRKSPASWRARWAERLAPLRRWSGEVSLDVERLRYGEQEFREVTAAASLANNRLELERLRFSAGSGHVAASGWTEIQPDNLTGALTADLEQVAVAELLGRGQSDGVVSGHLQARLTPEALQVENTRLSYQDPAMQTQVEVGMETEMAPGGQRLLVQGQGQYKGTSLQLDLSGGDLLQALEGQEPYPLSLAGQVGQTQLRWRGQVQQLASLQGLRGQLQVEGPEAAELAGLPPQAAADFSLRGELSHSGERWALSDIQAQLGESQIAGEVALDGGESNLQVRLRADTLDLATLGLTPANDRTASADTPPAPWDQRLASQLSALGQWNAQVDLDVGRLRYGEREFQDVTLKAQAENGRVDLQRLRASAGGGTILASGWVRAEGQELRGALKTQLQDVDLDRALASSGSGLGSLVGKLQLSLGPQGLQVRDTQLDYNNPELDLRLELTIGTEDAAAAPRLQVEGLGFRRGRPFRFELTGGPLAQLISPSQPYPVEGDILSIDTAAHLQGTLTEPLRLQAADLNLWLKGPNPASLYPLLGLSLPELPPYRLQGRLRWEGDIVRFTNLQGQVGDSDLSGDMRIQTGERPMLWATLASTYLDFDDLFPTVGAAPAAGEGETASAEQRQEAKQEEQDKGVFPTTPASFERLHAMDAVVRFQAKEVQARALPLNDLKLTAELRRGVLALEPLNFGLGGGDVTSDIQLNAREQPVTGRAELVIRGVNLKPLMERFDFAEDSFGVIGGEGEFRFEGHSIAEAMANLSGELELLMQGGRLDMFAVEIAGLDLGEALVAKLSEDDTVPLRCAYARFAADDGLAHLERFFIDTSDTNFTGAGQVDLDKERLEVVFEAHPKDFSLFALSSPVKLEGRLSELGVDILSGEVAGRLALAAVAGLIAPPAALLPLLDVGSGEDAGPGCEQVLAEAQTDAG